MISGTHGSCLYLRRWIESWDLLFGKRKLKFTDWQHLTYTIDEDQMQPASLGKALYRRRDESHNTTSGVLWTQQV